AIASAVLRAIPAGAREPTRASLDGRSLQGPDAPSSPALTHLGQTSQVLIDIPPKALGKLRPRQLHKGLHRGLREPARRPAPNMPDIRIPGSGQSTPGCIAGNRPALSAIAKEALEDDLVHLGGGNIVRGAEPHKSRQSPAVKSILDLDPQCLPGRR